MDLELAGSKVIVVGSAQGIGLAIARAFLAEQSDVALWDLKPDVLKVAEHLDGESASHVSACVADVRSSVSIAAAAAETLSSLGSLQHLVYAAGAGSGQFGFPFWNLSAEDWPAVLDINLVGAVRVLEALVPALTTSEGGSVTMITSVAGQIGSQTDPPYSAAKAGLINFTQCAARDLAPFKVRVNAIAPGMIRTELNKSVWEAWAANQPADKQLSYDEWADDKIRRVSLLGRWQEAEDIAQMAVMLASSRSGSILGQTINVDGGQVMKG